MTNKQKNTEKKDEHLEQKSNEMVRRHEVRKAAIGDDTFFS